jgi:hypothetical protein
MQIVPGLYTQRIAGKPRVTFDTVTDVNFIVGSADRGPIDEVTVGTMESIMRTFGDGELVQFVYRAYLNGAKKFKVVRVLGASPVKATKVFLATAVEVGTVTAKHYGAYGNDIDIQFKTIVANTRTMYVYYKDSLVGIVSGLTDGDSIVAAIAAHPVLSEWVVYTKTTNALPDANDSPVALSTGSDGSAIVNTDVIGTYDADTGSRTGAQLAVVTDGWMNLASATLEGDAAINAALITICETRGVGKCVLTNLEAATDTEIKSAADALTSANGRAAFWTGWYESYTAPDDYVSPVAALIGIYCRNDVIVSPGNNYINDALSVKKDYDYAQVEDFLLHKINVVAKGEGDSDNHFIHTYHSMNLTTDTSLTEIQITAVYDKINSDIKKNTLFAISKPNTPVLRDMVQEALKLVKHSCLTQKTSWGDGIVKDMWVQCDDSNNPAADQDASILNFDWAIQPIGAAHYVINRSQVTREGIKDTVLTDVIQ